MQRAEIVGAFKLAGLVLEASSRDMIERHLADVKSTRKRHDELSRIVDHVTSNPECKSSEVLCYLNLYVFVLIKF
jgi:hypothetical protein